MRLLVIEDDRTLRESLCSQLEATGFAIEQAGDGKEGLYFALEYPIDLAIVDLDLPPTHGLAEDGWDLVDLLRASSPTLPLILIAADCQPHTQAEALRLGARLLEKPINPRELRTLVSALHSETAPA